MRAQSAAQATAAVERKQKKMATGGEKKKREPSKTMGKWFPSATRDDNLELLAVEKLMPVDLVRRLPGMRLRHRQPPASECSTRSSSIGGSDSHCTGSCTGSYSSSATSYII